MAKRYIRINFQDSPVTTTPLSAANLNKLDKGIDDLDNAVVALENSVSALNDNFTQQLAALNNNFTQTLTPPTIISGRASNVVGGYIKIGKLVFISLQFTAAISGTMALIFGGFPIASGTQPLNAINTTDSTSAVCTVGTTYGYLNITCTSGKEYSVSGCYVVSN